MSTETQPKKEDKKSYKDTLNLPQTAFAMEAKLVQNEPARLTKWQSLDLYKALMRQRAGNPQWILHDGPPFANGDIHIGHLINKTLKDVIVRFRAMQGFHSPYVPGWDCHGLPIEHKIQEQVGPKLREMPITEIRKLCFAYADKYVKLQSEQFQRLGIFGEWDKPYATMTSDYEASTLEVFARFVEAGLVYKKLKPVAWSVQNQTALADAELEYKDVQDPSVYVEFPLTNQPNTFLLVWTTTPWTLPANLAVAVHPDVQYRKVKYRRDGQERFGIVAADLVERVFKDRAESCLLVESKTGLELIGLTYKHPFIDRTSRIVAADYVTTTDGTGLVHTAPGHGEDDYETGIREKLDIYSPVLANGRFDHTAPQWLHDKTVWEANPLIVDELKRRNLLFAEEPVMHSYPHDWRSKKPIIFRATEQWFVAVDKSYTTAGGGEAKTLRRRALEVADTATFIPDWGRARLRGMLESRPDWCISRQRAWGLPIPVFYNEKGEALLTPDSVRAVAKRFAQKGSDAWFNESPAELLRDFDPGPNFPKDKLRQEKDIFDVWFESGSSWNAVLRARPYLAYPSDMYLEGSDQHRGWFQLSLLCALGATGQAPFKQVLTHGFSVKPDGTKVSKSDKEYVTVVQEVNRHGADLLRLWVCSVDYQNDMPTSPKVIQEFGDKYRKVRNTLRYLLSNLYDYDGSSPGPAGSAVGAASAAVSAAAAVPLDVSADSILGVPLNSLDGWAMAELDNLIEQVTEAYDKYQLHRAFRLLHDFCSVQISAVYGNAMKDRLYCELSTSPQRRRTQFVMHQMLLALTKLLAPMIVFTADEAWEHIPHKPADDEKLPSVHLALLPKPSGVEISPEQREEWKLLMDLRDSALSQLDALKKQIGLNKAIDAEIVYQIDDDSMRQKLQAYGPDLEDLVGAGHHTFAEKQPESPAVTVKVLDRRETYKACARSWKRRPDVGSDAEYPDLTLRDAAAVKATKNA